MSCRNSFMTGSRPVDAKMRDSLRGKRTPVLSVVLLAVLLMAGCGGAAPPTRTSFVEFSPDQRLEIESTKIKEYEIQEGDVLKIAFSYEKDLTQEGVIVLSDGSVNLLGVDRVEVAGMSVTDADEKLTLAYSKEYRDPDLSIMIQQTPGRKVYVLGEVRKPGFHRVPAGGLDVMGAVGIAGGFSDDAARAGVVLVRVTPEGYMVREINLDNFASVESAALATINLEPLDVIYVPRSRIGDFSYFSRSVLSGIVSITRIATDLKYLSNGGLVRF